MATGSFTYVGSQMIMEYLFQSIPLTGFTPWVGIGVSVGTKQSFQEMTGSGYSRVELDSTYFDPPTIGSILLARDVTFPISTGYTGQTYAIGFYVSNAAPSPFAWANCTDQELIKLNDQLVLLAGGYNHNFLASSHFSMWLKNAILNHCYRGVSLEFTSSQFEIGYTTTAPTPTAIGTEPVGNNYSRKILERNSTIFNTSAFASQELTLDVGFDVVSGSQGSITHLQYFIDGQYVMFSPLVPAVNLNIVPGVSYPNLVIQSGSLYQLDP
jgi:hypothetical protein